MCCNKNNKCTKCDDHDVWYLGKIVNGQVLWRSNCKFSKPTIVVISNGWEVKEKENDNT